MANLPRESYLTPLERKWDSGMNFKYTILSYGKKIALYEVLVSLDRPSTIIEILKQN